VWGGEGVGGWEKRVLFGGEGGNRDDKPLFLPRDCQFFPRPAEPHAGTAFLTLFPFVTLFSPPLFFQARARIRIRIRMPLRYTVL